jgi:hypothetical protein
VFYVSYVQQSWFGMIASEDESNIGVSRVMLEVATDAPLLRQILLTRFTIPFGEPRITKPVMKQPFSPGR